MSILKFKKPDGTWESVAAIKGEPGKDGAVQYQAGEGIKIEDNVISVSDAAPVSTIYHLTLSYSPTSAFSSSVCATMMEIINKHYLKTNQVPSFLMVYPGAREVVMYHCQRDNNTTSSKYLEFVGYQYIPSAMYSMGAVKKISQQFYYHGTLGTATANFAQRTIEDNKYLATTNQVSFTPTSNYHPATKKYVDDIIKSESFVQQLVPNTYSIPTGNQIELSNYYTVENISTDYGFEINTNGFYESNNKGISDSHALCKVTFNLPFAVDVPISYINYGEIAYDYGIFSNVDTTLTNDNSADTTNVYKKLNQSSDNSYAVKTLTYTIPGGEHFIYIKYRKDNRGDSYNDSLQFKLPETLTVDEYAPFTFANKEYVDDQIKASITSVLEADY